jgi:hypothetical protein
MIPRIPGFVPQVPSIGMKASVDLFFDRTAIRNAMSAMDHAALFKSGGLIRDRVRRIIKRRGMARIPTKIRDNFPGAGIQTLMSMGVLGKTWVQSGRAGRRIIREVQNPPHSPAGSPPFTHTPESGHPQSYIGFRRNLWYYFDRASHSVVVGPSRKGRMIPYLHEFGGTLKLKTWVFVPQIKTKRGGMKSPIIMRLPAGQQPTHAAHWKPMRGFEHKSTVYPARPFMKPAMEHCIANGSIARAFEGKFKSSAGSRSGFTVSRG